MRGRKPLPTAIKILRGTARRDRMVNVPEPEAAAPDCPEHLNHEAKAEYDRLAVELYRLGVLSLLDRSILAAHCIAVARLAEAERKITELGCIVRGANGGAQLSPWLSVANKALEQVKSTAIELGLTPSARSRIHVEPREERDEFGEFLARVDKRQRKAQ